MAGNLLVFGAAIGLFGQTSNVPEGRKRVKDLHARTYAHCGNNDFRLVEDRSGPGGSQQFLIAEYQKLSSFVDIQVDEPQNTKGLEYRGVLDWHYWVGMGYEF